MTSVGKRSRSQVIDRLRNVGRLFSTRSLAYALGAALVLVSTAGCGGGTHKGATGVSSGSSTGLASQLAHDYGGWQCATMVPTSVDAVAADVAAIHAGDVGNSSGTYLNFNPQAATMMQGTRYTEVRCVRSTTSTPSRVVAWYQPFDGGWVRMAVVAFDGTLSHTATAITVPTTTVQAGVNATATALADPITQVFESNGFGPTSTTCSLATGSSSDYFCKVTNTSTDASLLALYQVDQSTGLVSSLAGGAGGSPAGSTTGAAQPTTTGTTGSSAPSGTNPYPLAPPCPPGESRDGAGNCVGPDNCPQGTEQNSAGQCIPLPDATEP